MELPPTSHITVNAKKLDITIVSDDNLYKPTYEQIEAIEDIVSLQNQYITALENEHADAVDRRLAVQRAVDEYYENYGDVLGVEL